MSYCVGGGWDGNPRKYMQAVASGTVQLKISGIPFSCCRNSHFSLAIFNHPSPRRGPNSHTQNTQQQCKKEATNWHFSKCANKEKFNILDVDGGGDRFHLLLYWELLCTIQDILYKPPDNHSDGWLFRTWERTKEAKRSNRLQTVSVTSSNLSHNTKDIKNRSGHIVTITEEGDPGWPRVKTGMRPIGRVVC